MSEAINQRRSVREFSAAPILLFQLSQILWVAQGVTDPSHKLRAIPSAGGTYPLEIFIIIGDNSVAEVSGGVYHYEVESHTLSLRLEGDLRSDLSGAALGQDAIYVAPVSLLICAVYDRTLMRYSTRGERYLYLEAGHAGQNICLQATALGLAAVAIGAFRDEQVREFIKLDAKTRPIYIIPVGKKA